MFARDCALRCVCSSDCVSRAQLAFDCGFSCRTHRCAVHLAVACGVMDPPCAKRSRSHGIIELKSKLPYISQSAPTGLLQAAKDAQLPDAHTALHVRNAKLDYVNQRTPYGPIHQEMAITDKVTTEVQHPFAVLYHCAKHSQSFSSLLQRSLRTYPPDLAHPWRLILYSDEVSPGNQLAYVHARKTWTVYWSFLEFGAALSSEDLQPPARPLLCGIW